MEEIEHIKFFLFSTHATTQFFNGPKIVRLDPGQVRSLVINRPSVSVLVFQIYKSADPDPYEIFRDPKHCLDTYTTQIGPTLHSALQLDSI
jgi:hypothetical protein